MMETIRLADWQFAIDLEATRQYTMQCSTDHCLCPYCRNFYENADPAQPRLRQVLSGFGAFLDGPCEVMPLQHNVILAAYRITGEILRKGHTELFVDDVPLIPEASHNGTFLLWVGPMELPWTQNVAPEDVISPANEPAFLERMTAKWLELTTSDNVIS